MNFWRNPGIPGKVLVCYMKIVLFYCLYFYILYFGALGGLCFVTISIAGRLYLCMVGDVCCIDCSQYVVKTTVDLQWLEH